MMIESAAARWLLTALRKQEGRSGGRTGPRPMVMCAALIAMTLRPEPATAGWVQAAGFGCAAPWFGLASPGSSNRFRRLT
jgi:hypothetical protein